MTTTAIRRRTDDYKEVQLVVSVINTYVMTYIEGLFVWVSGKYGQFSVVRRTGSSLRWWRGQRRSYKTEKVWFAAVWSAAAGGWLQEKKGNSKCWMDGKNLRVKQIGGCCCGQICGAGTRRRRRHRWWVWHGGIAGSLETKGGERSVSCRCSRRLWIFHAAVHCRNT